MARVDSREGGCPEISFPRRVLLRPVPLPKRIKGASHRVRSCAYLHRAAVSSDRMKAGVDAMSLPRTFESQGPPHGSQNRPLGKPFGTGCRIVGIGRPELYVQEYLYQQAKHARNIEVSRLITAGFSRAHKYP